MKVTLLIKILVILFIIISTSYLLFSSGIPWVPAYSQLEVSRQIVNEFLLLKSGKMKPSDWLKSDGRYNDLHGITNVLLMIPLAVVEPHIPDISNIPAERVSAALSAFLGVFVSSFTCLVFFLMLLYLGISLRPALYSTFCFAFLTIFFAYSSCNYEGNLNALFIISSLYTLFLFQDKKRLFCLMFCGAFAGLAINTREFSFIFLFCLIIYVSLMCYRERNIKILFTFIISLVPFLMLWGYYNWLRTGWWCMTLALKLVLINYETSLAAPTGNIFVGLTGLLFGPGESIFVYSPIFIFAMFGWRSFFKLRRKECSLILSIIILFLLANAKIGDRLGLWCWGPRILLAITPLIMLPLGFFLEKDYIKKGIGKLLFIMVAFYSLLLQLTAALTNWHGRMKYLLEGRKGMEAFLWNPRYSQWWDGLKTLFINIWNLMFGSNFYIDNPVYDVSLSARSLYMSKTLYTWWNGLLYEGINPAWIAFYLIGSLGLICFCLVYLRKLVLAGEKT